MQCKQLTSAHYRMYIKLARLREVDIYTLEWGGNLWEGTFGIEGDMDMNILL